MTTNSILFGVEEGVAFSFPTMSTFCQPTCSSSSTSEYSLFTSKTGSKVVLHRKLDESVESTDVVVRDWVTYALALENGQEVFIQPIENRTILRYSIEIKNISIKLKFKAYKSYLHWDLKLGITQNQRGTLNCTWNIDWPSFVVSTEELAKLLYLSLDPMVLLKVDCTIAVKIMDYIFTFVVETIETIDTNSNDDFLHICVPSNLVFTIYLPEQTSQSKIEAISKSQQPKLSKFMKSVRFLCDACLFSVEPLFSTILFTGGEGSGKTHCLNQIKVLFQTDVEIVSCNVKAFLIGGASFTNRNNNFCEKMSSSLDENPLSLLQLFYDYIGATELVASFEKPLLIVLDDLDDVSHFHILNAMDTF